MWIKPSPTCPANLSDYWKKILFQQDNAPYLQYGKELYTPLIDLLYLNPFPINLTFDIRDRRVHDLYPF